VGRQAALHRIRTDQLRIWLQGAARPDFLDRALIVEFNDIKPEQRKESGSSDWISRPEAASLGRPAECGLPGRSNITDCLAGKAARMAALECHKHRNRRADVPSTAFAATPIFPLRLAGGKADRAAEAAAFELDRAAHNLNLQPGSDAPLRK
jgi:hypothetical protein